MGVIYSVACKQCKVTRDLSKFYCNGANIKSRNDALKYSADLKKEDGLLLCVIMLSSFMAAHAGHECVFFHENMDCEEELDPYEGEYKEDTNYWDRK